MRKGIVLALSMVVVGFLALACSLPLDKQTVGRVSVDFSSYGGSSRAMGIPAGITSIDISVKAAGMADIGVTLTTPVLSATIEVPAGSARTFVVLAKDSGGVVKYKGKTSLDIQAGAVHELSVSMAVVFALSYDANGAVSGTAPATLYLETGEAITVAANSGGLSQAGYSFDGWNTASDGSGTDYAPGAAFTMGGADQALFAQWTASIYQVIFDANGGVGAMGPQSIAYDSMLPLMPNSFTRVGHTFEGWATAPLGAVIYSDTASFIMNVPGQTLYAQWQLNMYSITYMPNGATSGVVPAIANEYFGSTVPVEDSSGVNALVGPFIQDGIRQRFTGWNTDPGGAGTPYLPFSPLVLGAANVILYAQYQSPGVIVGQIGPADGLVFYDQGSVINGWRYLESSIADQAFAGVQVWSNITPNLGTTLPGLGEGLANTAAIIAQPGHATSAALLCDNYVSVLADWYLPSKDELNMMYANLYQAVPTPLGGFAPEYYWASTESLTDTYAWRQHFNTAAQTETIKTDNIARVRAIRRF